MHCAAPATLPDLPSVSPIISMQTVTDIEKAPNTVGALAPNTQALILDSEGRGEYCDRQED